MLIVFIQFRTWLLTAAALGLIAMQGCASVSKPDPRDPMESMNRSVFTANMIADSFVTKPIARTYAFVVPQFARNMVNNFFWNLGEIGTAANNVLQAKPAAAANDVGRFVVNTVFGFGGFVDIASDIGLKRNNEDFGQTLGKWGVPTGPYVMIPLLGPSTVRDAGARVVDQYTSPIGYAPTQQQRIALPVLQLVDLRSTLFAFDKLVEQSAVDPYAFIRDAYLQRRRLLVYDGDPPDELPKYEKYEKE